MKALQLVPAMEQGGVERGVVEVNRILVGARWENVVVSAGGRLADEIRRAEEEARLRKEEEERIRREQAEAEERERQRIKKENSFWNKAFKGLKEFGKKMVEEEE